MVSDRAPLEEQIKAAAHQLGFALIGITTPETPRTFSSYRRWIDSGRHAGMVYLGTEHAIERRQDPRRILPECQSIIVTGTSYLPSNHFAATQDAETRIASYALGDDYHDVIIPRLEKLVGIIEGLVGHAIPHKIYTDTGPILERDLAQRAGIGWIGKNTCLINPDHGSYFLLGEILLGLPLQADVPFESDRCGTCTRCIEACPTDCILPDRTIDSNRCISYLTIEEKGSVEEALRYALGNWLFGCDICQQVCPWNVRFAHPAHDPAFEPRPLLSVPTLSSFLELQPETWLENLRGSPLERPRRRRLVRSAVIAAANSGDIKHLKALKRLLLSDPESLVRSHAAWALSRFEFPHIEDTLRDALDTENDPLVLREINNALELIQASSN